MTITIDNPWQLLVCILLALAAREALNRERAAHGLPPIIRNVMAVADDW